MDRTTHCWPSRATICINSRRSPRPSPTGGTNRGIYDDAVRAQVQEAKDKAGTPDLQSLLSGRDTWTVRK
ncbi:MAG: hypothetical protein JWP64_6220 [Pseudonocardia sp.]|nr:hypothetical protein [Pseudonocardia sp.]